MEEREVQDCHQALQVLVYHTQAEAEVVYFIPVATAVAAVAPEEEVLVVETMLTELQVLLTQVVAVVLVVAVLLKATVLLVVPVS
jgi:hypothetical protein